MLNDLSKLVHRITITALLKYVDVVSKKLFAHK